jgi:hypothetical protein
MRGKDMRNPSQGNILVLLDVGKAITQPESVQQISLEETFASIRYEPCKPICHHKYRDYRWFLGPWEFVKMKLKLPEGEFKAYLFDCDGTIADSMPLHYVAWKNVLAEWNCEFSEELFYSWGGMPVTEIIASLNERHGLTMPVIDIQRTSRTEGGSRGAGAHRGDARRDSVRCCFREYARVSEGFSWFAKLAASL